MEGEDAVGLFDDNGVGGREEVKRGAAGGKHPCPLLFCGTVLGFLSQLKKTQYVTRRQVGQWCRHQSDLGRNA